MVTYHYQLAIITKISTNSLWLNSFKVAISQKELFWQLVKVLQWRILTEGLTDHEDNLTESRLAFVIYNY